MKVGACNISEEDRARAVEMHTALHEGLPPDELICETWSNERVKHKLGRATEIQYIKKIPDEIPSYHHPWAAQARPTIGVTPSGSVRIYAGKYETTRRGIEDRVTDGMKTVKYLKQPYVQPEYLPNNPTGLITLGKLEWIKYIPHSDGDGGSLTGSRQTKEKVLKFSESTAPIIAHDQNGDLHILGGQYTINEGLIKEPGVSNPMAHARKSRSRRSRHASGFMFGGYSNPRRRSHRGSRRGRRHNPTATMLSKSTASKAGDMILGSIIVGGVAVVSAVGIDMLMAKIAPTLSVPASAASKIGIGLAGGLLLAYFLPKSMESIPAGVSVGGVFEGFRDLYNFYIAPQLAPGPVVAITPPAAQAMLPGGIPQAYQAYSPQACGVAY